MICPKCGYRDDPLWRHSRYDFYADYMEFSEFEKKWPNREFPFTEGPFTLYRRGRGGIYVYRVPSEYYKVSTERKIH